MGAGAEKYCIRVDVHDRDTSTYIDCFLDGRLFDTREDAAAYLARCRRYGVGTASRYKCKVVLYRTIGLHGGVCEIKQNK